MCTDKRCKQMGNKTAYKEKSSDSKVELLKPIRKKKHEIISIGDL